jgi:hypothetical protein
MWTTKALSAQPLHWLAVAGTFCANPIRDSLLNTGCRNANPYNDGVVCADSASFNLGGVNLPTARWNGSEYAHTNGTPFGLTLFDGCNDENRAALDTPSPQSDLIQQLRNFINAQ